MDTTPSTPSSQPAPSVSPTGAPILPSWLPWVGSAIVGVAGLVVVASQNGAPIPQPVVAVCSAIVAMGAALGISSQGARKQG